MAYHAVLTKDGSEPLSIMLYFVLLDYFLLPQNSRGKAKDVKFHLNKA